tara:strand:+ start:72 stop:674 length:603 start_codon:yes stop_codon:yes gene_type:complete
MSSIKLTADSGNGTFEIKAPSSSSNTRVLTLPDTGNITIPDTNGITVVDNWYINSNVTVSSGTMTLTANWERGTSAQFGSIGSAMTQSSGIFTFPSTGIYYCSINGSFYRGTGDRRYIGFTIQTTTDNSSYSNVTSNYDSISGDTNSNTYAHVTSTAVFDVTNTSTHKVRFQTEAVDTGISITDVGGRYLNVVFIRLGDT